MIYTVAEDEQGNKAIIKDCRRYREDKCLGDRCHKKDRCNLNREGK